LPFYVGCGAGVVIALLSYALYIFGRGLYRAVRDRIRLWRGRSERFDWTRTP
jgi:hypothetical protein